MSDALETPRPPSRGPGPTDRAFGFTLSACALVVGGLAVLRGHGHALVAFGCAAVFTLASLLAPRVLSPLNRAWQKLGERVRRVTEPVFLALLFFLGFTPLGLLARALGKDFLALRFEPEASTYWHERPREEKEARHFERPF